ncbi:MAG: beta-ketoacyl-ACP synthase III [Pyrinomonadaceae bacterium]
MVTLQSGIIGTGSSYPDRILTNFDLEKMVDTSDEWITTRTGIKERHIAAEGEFTSQFASRAALTAIERAGIKPEQLDLIICATVTPDQILPSTACLIQAEIGANKAAAFDLAAACSGFIYGATLADQMIKSGQIKYALVIGAELLTRFVDYTDRGTCVIFGDGAGAAVMGPVNNGKGILASRIRSDGRFAEQLYAPGGGTRTGTTPETIRNKLHFFKMRGNELFKVAVRSMTDISREVLDAAGKSSDDIALVIPHQANQRITNAVGEKLGIGQEKLYSNIAYFGNTSSASIPIALDECVVQSKIKPGDLLLMTSFGGGVTWGALLMEW